MILYYVDVMTKQSIEFFQALIKKSPELRVLIVQNHLPDFTIVLQEFLKDINPRIKELIYNNELAQSGFRLRPRAFEYAVLCDVIDHSNAYLLEEIYHTLENSANIILISSKQNSIDAFTLKNLLDSYDFLAINEIDIFDNFYLVCGKKMHKWGSGL